MNLPVLALRRGAALTIVTLLATALVACSSADGDAGEPAGATVAVTDGAVEISADDLAFSAGTIEAPAGEPFTITLTNNEAEPHNLSVYTEQGGERLVEGTVISEGETTEVEVAALDAGEYYFVCDIHPEMHGTLVVEG